MDALDTIFIKFQSILSTTMPSSESKEVLTDSSNNFEDKDKEPKVPTYASLILILLLFGQIGVVYLINNIVPTPLTVADEKEHKDSFITERARNDLEGLMQVGPRVQGSWQNEEFSVNYLLNKINDIKNNALSDKNIEIDHQVVSSVYNMNERTFINAYGNIQNIVVKLHGKSKESVLINVHFDTVPISPGGSDDGINCAVALEVLRKLSKSLESFQHSIIFLFNGAEETPLQASHAFITQHKWAKEVKVFINLDTSGVGGKAMLFQVGPRKPWLLSYYRKAPHAYANVIGEELFLSGLIPPDTDFRIFANFGNLSGFDFAINGDGYRYHTSFDGFDNIPNSSYQYVGDIALSLARTLANAEELKNVEEQPTDDVVYYDYVGLFLISYTQTVAIIMHSVLAVLLLLVTVKSLYDFRLGFSPKSVLYLSITLGGILIGWILAAACVIIIGVILDAVKFSMSWYANPWLIFGLYVAPSIACTSGFIVLLNKFNPVKLDSLTANAHAQIQALCILLIWTVTLVVLTIVGIRSVFLIFISVLFQLIALAIINVFYLQERLKIWPFIYIAGTILPNVPVMQFVLVGTSVMIPMMGISGNHNNPELIIAILALVQTLLMTSFYTPLITIIRKPLIILIGLFSVFLLFLIFVFTPVGFPYNDNLNSPMPQRFWIYHASRTFRNDLNQVYKTDSGYFLVHKDRNSPHSVESYVDELLNATSIEEDCKRSLYCGLPMGRDKVENPEKSTWIPAKQPLIVTNINLTLNSKTSISKTVTRYHFTSTGPDHTEIYMSPRHGASLIATSLGSELPAIRTWNDRPLCVIVYGWGRKSTPLTFSIDITTSSTFKGPALDIALLGRYMHVGNSILLPEYRDFLSKFPKWTDVMPMLSTYESWVY